MEHNGIGKNYRFFTYAYVVSYKSEFYLILNAN